MARSMRVLAGLMLVWIATVLVPAGVAHAGGRCLPSGGCATLQYAGALTGSRGAQMHLGWRLYLTGADIAGASLYLDGNYPLTV